MPALGKFVLFGTFWNFPPKISIGSWLNLQVQSPWMRGWGRVGGECININNPVVQEEMQGGLGG